MKNRLSLAMLLWASSLSAAPLGYYFDPAITFNKDIPTPDSVLGYEVGEWHVRHDQLVSYMQLLAEKSDRISFREIGRTHQQRPLVQLIIASPEKQTQLDVIRQARLEAISKGDGLAELPAVAWMGYSVHGNESSGSNAALLVAYYLAAANDERVSKLLKDTIIVLDPSLNPDGLARFANWANSTRNKTASSDPAHREHNEPWPSSRTNHYLFDLNRDWLPLQHPESQARLKAYHDWKPNLLTDFHEMGPHSTYFFQPGVPSRTNPLTPKTNISLTERFAQFHAQALDAEQQLYFTKESFDDFYYGKGSTYPDINGAVGILFEQASSRGHLQQTQNGPLSFSATIKNQLTTSMSSFDALLAEQQALKAFQQAFYNDATSVAKKAGFSGYVVDLGKDASKAEAFMAILSQHKVEAYTLTQPIDVDTQRFAAQQSVYIPLEQLQSRVVEALFSEQTEFNDNTFYDVSGWTMAHAFDLPFAKVKRVREQSITPFQSVARSAEPEALAGAYAYAFRWQDSKAPALLSALLKAGIEARIAGSEFSVKKGQSVTVFEPGTILIPAGLQLQTDWFAKVQAHSQQYGIPLIAIQSGLAVKGIDLGSRQFAVAKLPKVLLVGGEGVRQSEVGEVWHHLDTRLNLAPTLVYQSELNSINLDHYTHIVFVDGQFSLSEKLKQNITQWLKQGGVIWGHKRGARLLLESKWLQGDELSAKTQLQQFAVKGLRYDEQDALAAQQRIAGAIFQTQLDTSNPLSFGMNDARLPVFKDATWMFAPSDKPFSTVARYTEQPLLAGFSSPIYIENMRNNPALIAHNYGKGVVIGMVDNPVFRGYWHGSSRLFTNALFLGHTLQVQHP